MPGSARLAMKVTPPFDRYYFIEKNEDHCAALRRIAADFADRSIECHCADANLLIQRICRETAWHGRIRTRGVAFLDPYGMQIGWTTVEAIARTRAIDCWYFFPLMGLYRQAANLAPSIDARKRAQLNWVLGTPEWERAWYSTPHGPVDLLGDPAEAVRIADVAAIERFVKARLENVFEGGVLEPRRSMVSVATRWDHYSSQSRIPSPHRWQGGLPVRSFAAPSLQRISPQCGISFCTSDLRCPLSARAAEHHPEPTLIASMPGVKIKPPWAAAVTDRRCLR